MHDFWTPSAVKLQAELDAAGVALSAADEVIAANAGGWFAAMGANEKASVIATMRNLAMCNVNSEDQWQAWRIGRDSRAAGDTYNSALSRLKNTFPQAEQLEYFEAGFSGLECPDLTALNPA